MTDTSVDVEYRVYGLGGGLTFALAGVGTLILLAVITWIDRLDPEANPSFWPWGFLYILIIAVIFVVWGLRVPRKIVWKQDDEIVFEAPLRRLSLRPDDVISLRPRQQLLVLRHRSGKLSLERSYDGLSDLVVRLKSVNPAFEVRGL